MSRRTKPKTDGRLAILANGQVVRMDTLINWPEGKQQTARGYEPGKVVYEEPDLDHTRAHRDELRLNAAAAVQALERAQ